MALESAAWSQALAGPQVGAVADSLLARLDTDALIKAPLPSFGILASVSASLPRFDTAAMLPAFDTLASASDSLPKFDSAAIFAPILAKIDTAALLAAAVPAFDAVAAFGVALPNIDTTAVLAPILAKSTHWRPQPRPSRNSTSTCEKRPRP